LDPNATSATSLSVRSQIGPVSLLAEWTRTVFQRSPLLHRAVARLRSRRFPSALVRRRSSKIVIEAYPRSANSISVRMFRAANPGIDRTEITHHTHSIQTVKYASKWGIPVLVILRNPIDAVSSSMIAYGNVSDPMITVFLTKYIDFHKWLPSHCEGIVLARFEEVIGDGFREVCQRINANFGTSFATDFDARELRKRAEERILEDSPKRERPANIPIPSEERSLLLEQIKPRVAAHPLSGRAQALYRELIEPLP
jgi:hypothetical protein